jgi:hypothetical protein
MTATCHLHVSPIFSPQPTSLFCITGPNIMPLSVTWSPLEFCLLIFYKHFSSLGACYTLTQFHNPSVNLRNNNTRWRQLIMKFFIMQFSPPSSYFLRIKSKYSPECFVPQSTRQSTAPVLNDPPSLKNFRDILLISLTHLIVDIIISLRRIFLHWKLKIRKLSSGWSCGPAR